MTVLSVESDCRFSETVSFLHHSSCMHDGPSFLFVIRECEQTCEGTWTWKGRAKLK